MSEQHDIVERLRATPDCKCAASGRNECGCCVEWPEDCCDEAADEIERLQSHLSAATEKIAEMEKELHTRRADCVTLACYLEALLRHVESVAGKSNRNPALVDALARTNQIPQKDNPAALSAREQKGGA